MVFDYHMNTPLELCPGWNERAKPAFESDEAYQRFREEFAEAVAPELERNRQARAASELESMSHWIGR
jgi:hypothetical protein